MLPGNESQWLGHDAVGNQTNLVDALNRTNRFEHDNLGRRTREVLPGNESQWLGYDAGGNLTRQTNFNGVILTNQYDALNRLTNRISAGGYQVRWTHTATGQRASMVDASGTNTYAYDSRDRLLTNHWFVIGTNQNVTLSYGYDDFGNLRSVMSSTPNGTQITNLYDPLNRLTNVTDRFGQGASYLYDGAGNLDTARYANAVTNRWQYDRLNRLTNMTATTAAGTIATLAYQLAPVGNRTNLSETIGGSSRTFTWQYDPLYRLTNEVITGTAPTGGISYRYDTVGNRTKRTSTVSGLTNQTFSYTSNDRLTSDSYDANGSTTNSAGNTYQYDVEGRLTNAVVGGSSITYVYDGDGNRVREIVGTTTNSYLVDTRNLTGYAQVLEESVNGTLSKVYAYGLDLIAQRDAGGSTYYFGQDGLGSTRLLTTTNATVANAFAYDAFGTLIVSNAAPQTDYLFTGEQRDANLGFYYLRARYLNPGTGRFWSRDTYAGNIYDPPSLHRYTYAHNDPVNGVDPSGHEFLPSTLAAITIAVILVAVDVGLISQVTVNYRKYFGLGDRNRELALQHNNDVIAALQRILASEGERTFQDEHLGVGGQMGTILPGSGPFQEAANLFESFPWNIEGYPTAIEEWLARISTDSFNPTPVEDSIAGTPEKRVVLARALLHRQEAFGRWLKRNL